MTHNQRSVIRLLPILLLLAACQTDRPCPEKSVKVRFMSQLELKGDNAITVQEGPADAVLKGVFGYMLNLALDGKIQALDPMQTVWDLDTIIHPPDRIRNKLYGIDTMFTEDDKPPYDLVMKICKDSFQLDQATSIRPYEEWRLDGLHISKEVKGYTLVREYLDCVDRKVHGHMPIMTVRNLAKEGTPKKIATIRYIQPINRAVAIGDLYDWYRQNLEISVREAFFGGLVAKALDGSLTAYATPAEGSPLAKDALSASLQQSVTAFIESPDPPHAIEKVMIDQTCGPLDIVAIEFVQDVYLYDNGTLDMDVKWYGPVTGVTDKWGKVTNPKTLFWVKN